jgi:hypothetical protein
VASRGDFGADASPDRGVRLPDGTLADERGGDAPKPGEPFVVYRLGRSTTEELAGNAGNADGVARHLVNVDDFEKPKFAAGSGDTIHAFRVVVAEEFGPYEGIVGGRPTHGSGVGQAAGEAVGRTSTAGPGQGLYRRAPSSGGAGTTVAYSFPKGGKFKAERIASVPLSRVREILGRHADARDSRGAGNFDLSGSLLGAEAIREAFKKG